MAALGAGDAMIPIANFDQHARKFVEADVCKSRFLHFFLRMIFARTFFFSCFFLCRCSEFLVMEEFRGLSGVFMVRTKFSSGENVALIHGTLIRKALLGSV